MPSVPTAGSESSVDPLGAVAVPGAVVYPMHPSDDPHRMHYGVLRNDATLVESTVRDRHHGAHTFIAPDPGRFNRVGAIAREAIYAGPLYRVYGHFILESCQRLWWAVDHPELPIVYTADDSSPADLNRWQRDVLQILGVRNELIVVTQPTRVDLLHVPDAGYRYADWSHPQHIAFLAAYDGPPQQNGTKLWLSRDPAHGASVINRHIIERRLQRLGWTVVTFEKMTVRDQLDAMARAEVIAGEEASTFHNLLLLKDVTGKRFQIFRRHGPEHLSFTTIGDARAVDQRFHSCSQDAVISAEGRAVVRLAPNPAQYLSHLGVPIPEPPPPRLKDSSDAVTRYLNRLGSITGAETYLQLGSGTDQAFNRVRVACRDVVDDEFPFDVRSFRDRGTQFYELPVEQFLAWFARGRTYDLVLVDDDGGWRDAVDKVATVLSRAAHERTVVVVDASSWVENSSAPPEMVSTRRPTRPGRRRRSDDVSRAVAALHDRHPDLRLRINRSGQHAQIVVNSTRRHGVGPLLGHVRTRLTRLCRCIRSRHGS